MLVKQGLIGVQNGCIVIRLQWHLPADIFLKMAGSDLEFDTVQKIQVLGDEGMCLKPYPQWPLGSILDA